MDSRSFLAGVALGGAMMAVGMASLALYLRPQAKARDKLASARALAASHSTHSDTVRSAEISHGANGSSRQRRDAGPIQLQASPQLASTTSAEYRNPEPRSTASLDLPHQRSADSGSYDERAFPLRALSSSARGASNNSLGSRRPSGTASAEAHGAQARVGTEDTHMSVHLPGSAELAAANAASASNQPVSGSQRSGARSNGERASSASGGATAATQERNSEALLATSRADGASASAAVTQAGNRAATCSDDLSDDDAQPASPVRVIVDRSITEDYELLDVLGRGTFSVVRKCAHKPTGEMRAVKCIDAKRFKLSPSFKQARLLEEVQILATLRHPSIIKLYDVYWDRNSDAVFLVTELAPGGELFDSIISAGNFSEAQARHVMWQALSAVGHLHKRGIIHRDLKPENILVFNSPSGAAAGRDAELVPELDGSPALRIKLADFGTSRYLGPQAHATSFVGSPQYVAPEVLFARDHAGSYNQACDIWSLGCIAYVMLAGYLPFDDAAAGDDGLTWEQRIKVGRFQFAPPVWTHISEVAKDLIQRMLTVQPHARPDVAAAMSHPWFQAHRAQEQDGAPARALSPLPSPAPAPAQISGYAGSEAASLALVLQAAGQGRDTEPRGPAPAPANSRAGTAAGAAWVGHKLVQQPGPSPPPGLADMVTAVESAMNLRELRQFQEAAAECFGSVYQHARGIPTAAHTIRMHAVQCRDLQIRVLSVISKFRAGSVAMRDVLADIEAAVDARDSGCIPPLFEQLRTWIGEMKQAAAAIQDNYSAIIASIQTLIQRATAIQDGASSDSGTSPAALAAPPARHGQRSATVRSSLSGADLSQIDGPLCLRHPRSLSVPDSQSEISFDAMFDAPAVVGNPGALARLAKGMSRSQSTGAPASRSAGASSASTRTAHAPDTPAGQGSDASARASTPLSPRVSPMLGPSAAPRHELMIVGRAVSSQPVAGGHSGSPSGGTSLSAEERELLVLILNQLKSVDALLLRVVGFWSSMELVVDVVVQRKTATATVLEHATSSAMQGRALQRLSGYKQFWRAMEWLCDNYVAWAKSAQLYAFLNE